MWSAASSASSRSGAALSDGRFRMEELDKLRAELRAHKAQTVLHDSGWVYDVELVGPPTGTTFTATKDGEAKELVPETCTVVLRGRILRPTDTSDVVSVTGAVWELAEAPVAADEATSPLTPGDQPWIQSGRLA